MQDNILMQAERDSIYFYSKDFSFSRPETLNSPGLVHAVSDTGLAVVDASASGSYGTFSVAPIRDLESPHHHLQIPENIRKNILMRLNSCTIGQDSRVAMTYSEGVVGANRVTMYIFDATGKW